MAHLTSSDYNINNLKQKNLRHSQSKTTPPPPLPPRPPLFPFLFPYLYSNLKGIGNCPKSSHIGAPPPRWDWRKYDVVTPVRNQLTCGSCWAFTVCQTIESAMLIAIANGKIISTKSYKRDTLELSAQQILDWDQQAKGCTGGSAPTAFEYVYKSGGLTDTQHYPYINRQNYPIFRQRNYPIIVRIKAYCIRGNIHGPSRVQEHLSEEDIIRALLEHGPLYVLIYGESSILQNYKSGILDHPDCYQETNHAVLLVGYDEHSWLVKNSWGPYWGEQGYFRLVRGKNMCGINSEIAYAIL